MKKMLTQEEWRTLNFEEIRKSKDYYYSGYWYSEENNTPKEIVEKYQELANTKMEGESDIVSMSLFGYSCELDIFWEEYFEGNISKLVIELFVTYENNTINNSSELSIVDILKPNYLERVMFDFLVESATD